MGGGGEGEAVTWRQASFQEQEKHRGLFWKLIRPGRQLLRLQSLPLVGEWGLGWAGGCGGVPEMVHLSLQSFHAPLAHSPILSLLPAQC